MAATQNVAPQAGIGTVSKLSTWPSAVKAVARFVARAELDQKTRMCYVPYRYSPPPEGVADMKSCFLFPGQGAQYPGMGRDLWQESDAVRELFRIASESSGMDLQEIIFEGTEEELKATDKTQIAVTLINVSAAAVMKEKGIEPDGVAGFSLGEYAALHEAGVIRSEDLFPMVKARGVFMEKASRGLDSPSGNPGMAAVIGLEYERVMEVVERIDGIYLGLYNSPVQVVVAGTFDGLQKAEAAFEEAGARRFVRLKVSGPFHTPLLQEASDALRELLDGCVFSDPRLPVYANVTGKRIATGTDARQYCIQQIVRPVRWVEEERSLVADGYDTYYEVGPGTVLTGLWRYIDRDNPCRPAGKLEEIEQL